MSIKDTELTYEQMRANIKDLCGAQSISYYNFMDFKGQTQGTVEYVYQQMVERELYFATEELRKAQEKMDKVRSLITWEVSDDGA